jgi:xanthine/CO dehydrogenase XdhC/CoxF family maturation factor
VRELRDLLNAWRGIPDGDPIILATVVETRGSTYRRPGARMLLTREGWLAGSISGGCLESDLLQTAWDRTASGPNLVTYDATSSEDLVWGFGLGCNGAVDVLLERLSADGGPLAFLETRMQTETPGVIATVIEPGPDLARRWYTTAGSSDATGLVRESSEGVLGTQATALLDAPERVLLEAVLPPLRLGIYGAGFDARPLVSLASQLGWTTVLIDNKKSYANPDRFPDVSRIVIQPFDSESVPKLDAVVVMTHHYLNDLAILKRVVPSDACYVGLLGPRVRAQRLVKELVTEDPSITEAQLARLRAPVGLDLGAEGPHEIALAIVSEIQALLRHRSAGFLSDKPGSVHAA